MEKRKKLNVRSGSKPDSAHTNSPSHPARVFDRVDFFESDLSPAIFQVLVVKNYVA